MRPICEGPIAIRAFALMYSEARLSPKGLHGLNLQNPRQTSPMHGVPSGSGDLSKRLLHDCE
jgi:hypothetical protein